MKKYRFKKWVNYLLGIIAFLSLMVMGSDCDNLIVFIYTHLIAVGVFGLTTSLLIKYGDLN